jgi:hypothetical protein
MLAPFLQTPAPPAPLAPPTLQTAPAPNVVFSGSLPGGAFSRQDIAALRARRSELSNQLESATGRRRQLTEQLRRADGVNKTGLESRIALLDERIVRIESELDQTGQQLSSPAAARVAGTRNPFVFGPQIRITGDEVIPIVAVITIFVFAPIALSISRLIWKRGSRMKRAPSLSNDSSQRLERIEQAMDAIAIEVERVSEGQRFVTRLLSERHPVAASPEPARVSAGDTGRMR